MLSICRISCEKLFVIFYNYKYKRAGELLKLKVGNFALIWQQRVDRGVIV